jgi:hypothetical protein
VKDDNKQQKGKSMKINANLINGSLETMTDEQINAAATILNLPKSKTRKATQATIAKAITTGKARLKVISFLKPNHDIPHDEIGNSVHVATLYSYKESKVNKDACDSATPFPPTGDSADE